MSITGERLRSLRLSHNMSQAEVAAKIGVTRVAYLQYENGVSRPVRKLKELAALFDVSVDYILGTQLPSTQNTTPTKTETPTADFINSLFANDPEGLAKINQAVIEINGLDTLDSLSDETRVLIKNALLLAAQEVDRIKANK